jgi:hypothetical protein
MKIIKITESQYKKLVKTKNLNEQFETVYKDESDKLDITVTILKFINWLTDQIGIMYNKNLFIDKIQDGVVYIDWEKYSEDEKNTIDSLINDWVKYTSDSNDELVFGNYFSGLDWDYGEDYKPKRLCWCNDTKNGEEIEYDCDETKPENCIELDVTDDSEIRQKIVDNAYSKLGQPYCHKTFDTDEGGDCSGLIDWVLRNTDSIDSPYNGRETSKVLKNLTKSSNKKKKTGLDKGDILVFNKMRGEKYGHVGFVYAVTDGKVDMIHSSGSKGVIISKDIFNNNFWSGNRYYGAIPIVDGKYESK